MITSCDCQDQLTITQSKLDSCLENQEINKRNAQCIITKPFVSKCANYDADGIYEKKMFVPYLKPASPNGRGPSEFCMPKSESLILIKTIMKDDGTRRHIVMELMKHNTDYREDMRSVNTGKIVTQFGYLKTLIQDLDHSKNDAIWLVSLHDEDYPYQNDSWNDLIANVIIDVLVTKNGDMDDPTNTCLVDIQDGIDALNIPKFDEEPTTVGGGVIPPK